MARPTQFEREEVLERAMQLFWEQGYNASSMTRLLEATDLKPGSLYAAFHSKEALFMAALQHYTQQSKAKIQTALDKADSPLQGVRDYFIKLAEETASPRARRSCLLVNTVLEMARQNDDILEQVNVHLASIETVFRDALERASRCGELASDRDPEELAAFIMTSIWGLRVLGSTASSAARTKAVVKQLLAVLG